MSTIQSAPWRILAMCAGSEAMFMIPILVAYYHLKGGATLGDFLLLQGIFRIAVFVLEIPTGFMADKWLRHHQLMASRVLWLLSGLVLLLATHGFFGLMAVEILAAFACALRSGTMEAYMHEALRASGITSKAQTTKWQGAMFATSMAVQSMASPIGGWLFTLNTDLPMVLTSIGALIALVASLTLPKVPMLKSSRHANPVKDLWLVTHHSLRVHPRLSLLLLGPFTLFAVTGTLFWLLQTRLAELGVSPTAIGWAMGSYFLLNALLGLYAGKLLAWLGERLLLAALPVCLVVGTFLMLTSSPWLVWVGALLGAGTVYSVGRTVATSLINHEVPDGERATVLSVASSVTTIISAAFMVLAEPMFNRFGLTTTMLIYLAVALSLSALPLSRLILGPQPVEA